MDLYQNEHTYQALFMNSPAILMIIDPQLGQLIDVNHKAVEFYGYSRDQLLSMSINEINTYSRDAVFAEMQNAKKENRNYFNFIHKLMSGVLYHVQVISYPIQFGDEEYLVSHIQPTQLAEEFIPEKLDISTLVDGVDEGVMIVTTDNILTGKVVYMNQTILSELGMHHWSEIETMEELLGPSSGTCTVTVDGVKCLNSDELLSLRNKQTDHEITFKMDIHPMRYDSRMFSAVYLHNINFFNDGNRDLLSNLTSRLKMATAQLPSRLINVSLFLNTNDPAVIREKLSCTVGQLQKVLHMYLVHARVVSDSTEILIYSHGDLTNIVNALNRFLLVFSCSETSPTSNLMVRTRISISDHGQISRDRIDEIMTVRKTFLPQEFNVIRVAGHGQVYSRSHDLKLDLLHAVERKQMTLHMQAIVNIVDRTIEAFEFLIRWQHPVYGNVSPGEFIAYAENMGYIEEIDKWVMEQAVLLVKGWAPKGLLFRYHINVSPVSLSKGKFIDYMIALVRELHVDPKCLVVEITEEAGQEVPFKELDKLKHAGFSLAVDDFGRGYSSFERIRLNQIDFVKIDKSFVQSISSSVDDVLILKAIIGMCKNLNIRVIAEGVEELEQLEFMEARNCNRVQGFLFDKPTSVAQLQEKLAQIHETLGTQLQKIEKEYSPVREHFENGRVIIQPLDKEMNCVAVSPEFARYLGYSLYELNGKPFIDLVTEEEKDLISLHLQHVVDHRDEQSIMVKLKAKTGQPLRVLLSVESFHDSGRMHLYLEFADNIDEEEMELIGLSYSYLKAFQDAPSGMILLSDDLRVLQWNRACEEIFGYSASEAKLQNLVKLVSGVDDQTALNVALNQVIKNQVVDQVIANVNRANEQLFCRWHISTLYDEFDQSSTFVCIVNDITKDLKHSRELSKINKAIDQSGSIIIIADPKGHIEYVNDKFEQVTGFTQEEVLGKETGILSSNEQSDSFYEDMWRTLGRGETWSGEFHNRKKDGTYFWSAASIYPVLEDNHITGYVSVQNDTTYERELVRINQDFHNKLIEQDKVASLGMLTSGIMHEINNPLSFVKTNVEYIHDVLDKAKQGDLDLEDLMEAIEDVTVGVNQIGDIAQGLKRFIFHAENLVVETVNLVSDIENVMLITKNEYKYHAEIIFDKEDDERYEIEGYSSKLKQVFMNMIINATHAIIEKNLDGLGQIYILLSKSDDHVQVTFRDTGIGMTQETMNKIFEPFFTTKGEGIGSGLGLGITQKIIEEEHQGTVTCTSEYGVGTTFVITLPIRAGGRSNEGITME